MTNFLKDEATTIADLQRLLNQLAVTSAAAQHLIKRLARSYKKAHPKTRTSEITTDALIALTKARRRKAKTITDVNTKTIVRKRRKVW